MNINNSKNIFMKKALDKQNEKLRDSIRNDTILKVNKRKDCVRQYCSTVAKYFTSKEDKQ